MIVLFILGLFGVKAAAVVYIIYLIAKKVTQKGDSIKKGYEDRIEELEQENKKLKRQKKHVYQEPVFVQGAGDA